MATQAKTILVTGATGQQGGAVAMSLLRQGQKVRVLTRNPDKAAKLTKAGAAVFKGDLTDCALPRPYLRTACGTPCRGSRESSPCPRRSKRVWMRKCAKAP